MRRRRSSARTGPGGFHPRALREAVQIPFTVKTRIGFDDPGVFAELLPIFERHQIDLLTVHGRTVREGYRSGVHYDYIARAVDTLPCPCSPMATSIPPPKPPKS